MTTPRILDLSRAEDAKEFVKLFIATLPENKDIEVERIHLQNGRCIELSNMSDDDALTLAREFAFHEFAKTLKV